MIGSENELGRRRLLGLAAAGVVAGGTTLASMRTGSATPREDVPPGARPGGAYDRFVADLAAKDQFSGVVLLAHKGRTVLSRAYGMADKDKGVANHEDTAFDLCSASQPFLPVAVLQLAQQGKLALADPVGTHLTGFPEDIAEQVTIHHLLTVTGGLDAPEPDYLRIFADKQEVHDYHEQWTRQATLVAPPGSADQAHAAGGGAGLTIAAQIVEAVTGMTYWDYVHEHVLRGAFPTRTEWLTDKRIAHPYIRQADGSRIDGVRHLTACGADPNMLDRNPARGFIGYAAGEGFATAPALVRFAQALGDGTLLTKPYADLLTGAKLPGHTATSFTAYSGPIHLVAGREWQYGRGGGNAGCGANWDVYPDSGWVGVVLSNYDDIPLLEILEQQGKAIGR